MGDDVRSGARITLRLIREVIQPSVEDRQTPPPERPYPEADTSGKLGHGRGQEGGDGGEVGGAGGGVDRGGRRLDEEEEDRRAICGRVQGSGQVRLVGKPGLRYARREISPSFTYLRVVSGCEGPRGVLSGSPPPGHHQRCVQRSRSANLAASRTRRCQGSLYLGYHREE